MTIQYEKDGNNLVEIIPTTKSYTREQLSEFLIQVTANIEITNEQLTKFQEEKARLEFLLQKADELEII